MSFIHLHNHSHYSLLDGLLKFEELIDFTKKEGLKAAAITDHGALYGVIEFYQKCKKADIKPIIGVETYLAPESRFDKNTKYDATNYHLVLLVKNNQGYKNLLKLISLAHLEGYYYKPRIDWQLLEKYHEGLIAMTACLGGEIPQLILADKLEQAKERILKYQNLFGKDNFYLEIMDHPELDGQEKVNLQMIEFSKQLKVPLVATNDAHYLKKDDDEAQDILLCLQNKKKLEDIDRMKMKGLGDYSLRSSKEMQSAFAHIPEALENSVKIADLCNLEIELGKTKLPHFSVPEGHDGNSYLGLLCENGLYKHYGLKKDKKNWIIDDAKKLNGLKIEELISRLDYELSVIAKMGWPAYFLIVADFVVWAKEQKIVVGPGRGSAAGSLVCYLTGITNIDPLKYDLLFERFLNPERISMPDIDLDFADIRRDEVIKYVEDKYGKDHVAQIITFGTMAARAAVRDVGRVLAVPYEYCDRLSKMIPMFTSLSKALETVPEVKEVYRSEEQAKKIIDYALRLEGVARHTSTHACGVLITPEPLTEYVPVQYASSADKSVISQYSLHPVEDLGLLKMDFLGLKNLSIIEAAIKIIKKTRGTIIDIEKIPLNDKLSYELFQKGNTTGIFQFESSGMKRYLRELKPTEFEDIIAMVALYRPGPMEWIPDYIAGKHKRKKVAYLHPKLEKILEKTYGVAIYQEQVMQIARDLAGFSMGQADILRKAMGKKIAKLLAEQKEKFIDGCVKNGIYKELALQIFSFIEPFADYGFNRSHAACYALIAYQTAYLKAHWPVEFMAALLTADQHDSDRVAIEIDECRKMNFKILAPDINESFDTFTVITEKTKENEAVGEGVKLDTIRFGLKAVKNVGEHIVEMIIEERKANGPYKDIFDFLSRVTDRDLNKKSLESLIKCGAFDNFNNRGYFLSNLEKLLEFNKQISKDIDSKQVSLFADKPSLVNYSLPHLNKADEIPEMTKINWEKELLGLYISNHPLLMFKKELENFTLNINTLNIKENQDLLIIAGVITTIKKIITRSNQSMIFAKIEDASASIELLVFPKLLSEEPEIWQEGNIVMVAGNLSEKDSDLKLLVNQAGLIKSNLAQESIEDFKRKLFQWRQANPNFQKYSNHKKTREKKAEPIKKKEKIKPIPKNNNPLQIVIKKDLGSQDLLDFKNYIINYSGYDPIYFKVLVNGKAKVLKSDLKTENTKTLREKLEKKFPNLLILSNDEE
jgi:DNA polymerase III subunit alpha